jgi:hypothetical protein
MWVIHQDILLSMPDAAPLPPNGKRVDLPDDFLANPRAYKIEGGAIVKRVPTEMKTSKPKPILTADEVLRVRAAIEKGVI